ncbi:hypothetical protein NDU88_008150 [Pleurodeles waltl]|uniref:Uncharacterized protein n=1 Tax=Pleurodeles waltl TaxID=8319 RepID=A0AAV7QMP1_PLEWA|nr:hypothetical protein NDU88_008150 [Pleurodeles waltl]
MEVTLHNHTSQFKKVPQAILDTKTTLETKIDAVTLDGNLLRTDHWVLVERVTETENDVAMLTPCVKALQENMTHLTTEVDELQRRAEDAEGRSRQNNIRLVGFPERAKVPSTELFLEKWLTGTVLQNKVPKVFSVERHIGSRVDPCRRLLTPTTDSPTTQVPRQGS